MLGGHVNTIEESAPARRRRRHSAEFKAKAVQDCLHRGVSIAAVALHHRVNANLLRRWVAEHQALDSAGEARALMTVPQAEFIPLQIGDPTPTPAIPDIQIEVRRGAATISIRWPGSAAAECGEWLQGWLR
ncbi:transposase [Cupriavidus metallidurans]|uniref:Transposase n=1 Tax=Cupriavidus metallidurans TaxID=119219 RepID=A0A482J0K9_9BURK|nr:transposase [Cupriavidus metallidurans]QGS31128.1 transposase [Cupriavidus metallidurans]